MSSLGSDDASGRRGRVATPLPDDLRAILQAYEDNLRQSSLKPETCRTYISRVRQFLAWLAGSRTVHDGALVFDSAQSRTVLDYRYHLLHNTPAARSAGYVNSALAAIDDFYAYLGLERAGVGREALPQSSIRPLGEDDQRLWVTAADKASSRDRALALTALYLKARILGMAALNVNDVSLGVVDRIRTQPVHSALRHPLRNWLENRSSWLVGNEDEQALFLNYRGGRLSTRSVRTVLVQTAANAGLDKKQILSVLRTHPVRG